MGVLRIARAEFIKIFKKPSVYLMGVLLAAVLVLSNLFFEPIGKQNFTANIDGSTVGKIYDKFTASNTSDLKQSAFDETISNAITKIDFYNTINTRNESLKLVGDEFTLLYSDLKLQHKLDANSAKTQTAFGSVKNKLVTYNEVFNSTENLVNNSTFYENFTTLPIYTEAKESLRKLTLKAQDVSTTPTIFVNFVDQNDYLTKLNKIYDTNKNYINSTIEYYNKQIKDTQDAYYNKVINNPDATQATLRPLRTALHTEISDFYDVLVNLTESKNTLAFIDKKQYETLKNAIAEAKSLVDAYNNNTISGATTEYQKNKVVITEIAKLSLQDKTKALQDSIIEYSASTKTLESLNNTITKDVYALRDGLDSTIKSLYQQNPVSSATKDMESIRDLITSYRVLSINTKDLVDQTIDLEATQILKSNEIVNYIGFDSFNSYETKESLTKINYLIDNGEYNQHFSDVFAFNKNSTTETNAYDFMFYGMEIATLIITVFAIFLAASLMASEYDSGTIKLLAMRPFKRWKIITGKLLATMIFAVIFILFSFVICYVAGAAMYPLTDLPVLMVFNSTQAFVVNPLVLMFINLICITFEVFFYSVIALSISTIFRSYTSAISISCIMYLLAISLNVLFGGALWYAYIPFINADLFKFLGGTFLTTEASAFNSLFTPTLLSNANFFISMGIATGTIVIFLLITYISFKLRDF
ncbi:MAG: ABC transporter permease subunit [Clostridia bacterium]|nr:ABC transporter permease subunit [Clostridia bacterium]